MSPSVCHTARNGGMLGTTSPTARRVAASPTAATGRRKSISGGLSLNIQHDVAVAPPRVHGIHTEKAKTATIQHPRASVDASGVTVSTPPREDFTAFLHRGRNKSTTTWIRSPAQSDPTDMAADATSPVFRTGSGTSTMSALSALSAKMLGLRSKPKLKSYV